MILILVETFYLTDKDNTDTLFAIVIQKLHKDILKHDKNEFLCICVGSFL